MAELIDKNSVLSGKSEIDLFGVPPTTVAVERSFWTEIHLTNPLTNQGPFTFEIPSDPLYLDLSRSLLYMRLSIQRADDTNIVSDQAIIPAVQADQANQIAYQAAIDPNDHVGPVNLLGRIMFRQVKVFIGSKMIFDSDTDFSYRAYIETELNYGDEPKATYLRSAGYSKDRPGHHIDTNQNVGWQERVELFKASREVELMTELSIDLFQQSRYLVNRCPLRIELYRQPDTFLLQSFHPGADYKLRIHEMRFIARKVDLLASASLGLEAMLRSHPARYPIRRCTVSTLNLTPGRYDVPNHTILSGQIPRRIVAGLITQDAYRGDIALSPFNFRPFGVRELSVTAAGINYPMQPLIVDFRRNLYMRAYLQFLDSLGLANDDSKSNGISYEDYKAGSCLFVFDLTSDRGSTSAWELVKTGTVQINLRFVDPVPAGGLKLILYSEFDNLISIDYQRNPFFDYQV